GIERRREGIAERHHAAELQAVVAGRRRHTKHRELGPRDRGAVRAGIARVAEPVTVAVGLIGIRDLRAVVGRIAAAVRIGIGAGRGRRGGGRRGRARGAGRGRRGGGGRDSRRGGRGGGGRRRRRRGARRRGARRRGRRCGGRRGGRRARGARRRR